MRYRLDDLGWMGFQNLCQALLKIAYGNSVEAWGTGHDLGRDAYLSIGGEADFPVPAVFQVKFVANANAAGAKPFSALKTQITKEFEKIAPLMAAADPPATYCLMTNVTLSSSSREWLKSEIGGLSDATAPLVLDGNDVCAMLDRHPRIRGSYPQLLGLADLQGLIDEAVTKGVRERSRFVLSYYEELTPVFVPTQAFWLAQATLSAKQYVVLTGQPEVGKTSIARVIGFQQHLLGWDYAECLRPDDFWSLYDAGRPQVFLADDAFGTTEFRPDIALQWCDHLERILRRVDGQHWLIWTSRTTPLRKAMETADLQGRAEEFPKLTEVTVEVDALSIREKSEMLYRHAKSARLDEPQRDLVRKHARAMVKHQHFTPERIRRFVLHTLPELEADGTQRKDAEIERLILREIEEPTDRMRKSFRGLTDMERRLLAAMLTTEAHHRTMHDVQVAFNGLMGTDGHYDISELVESLSHHFIKKSVTTAPSASRQQAPPPHAIQLDWMHPSWRDLVIDHLRTDQQDREHFLSHCGPPGIVLALSTGGGATGERERPLLISAADFDALRQNLKAQIRAMATEQQSGILYNLRLMAKGPTRPTAGLEMNHIVHGVLDTLRTGWDEAQSPVAVRVLDLYYELSTYGELWTPSPLLGPTWADAFNQLEEALLETSDEGYFLRDALSLWIDLLECLQENEPRFLKAMQFPAAQETLLERVTEVLSAAGDWDFRPSDKDEFESEIEALGDLVRLLTRFDELCERPDGVVADASEGLERHRDRLTERWYEDNPEEEDAQPTTIPQVPRYSASDEFDVSALFEDL